MSMAEDDFPPTPTLPREGGGSSAEDDFPPTPTLPREGGGSSAEDDFPPTPTLPREGGGSSAVPTQAGPVAEDQRHPARLTWQAFGRNPLGVGSVGVLALLVMIAICAPLIAHYPAGYGTAVLEGPSSSHWFGTDNLGRDVFAEVVWGSRVSILVGASASALAVLIGVTVAVLGAYFPSLDTAVGVVIDLFLSLPVLPLMILVAALAGPSLRTTILLIAAFSWPEVARVVRSQALSVVRLPYMDAARLIGGSHLWIVRKHLLPALTAVVVVSVVLTSSRAILAAAGLAFLGLSDPSSWSWGRILYEAQQSGAMSSAWWTTLFPSLAILALVVSATLISIAYNDARNPRTRKD